MASREQLKDVVEYLHSRIESLKGLPSSAENDGHLKDLELELQKAEKDLAAIDGPAAEPVVDAVEPHLTLFEPPRRWQAFKESLSILLKPSSKQPIENDPESALPAEKIFFKSEPWYRTLPAAVKGFFSNEKPNYNITAQPVEVPDIWADYKLNRATPFYSVILHIVVIALLIYVGKKIVVTVAPQSKVAEILLDSPFEKMLPQDQKKAGGGGGGGQRDPLPASKGKLPKLATQQIVPPTPKPPVDQPKLPVEPTVVVLAQLPKLNLPNYGDPLGANGPLSAGPGSGGGIGSGTGHGVGPGNGPGVGPGSGGNTGGGPFMPGRGGVSMPQCIENCSMKPPYSEEGYKLKIQGTVLLQFVVRSDGSTDSYKILRGLGYGLDEAAIETVRKWHFRPGYKDGKSVDVYAQVEVNFRLF
ncbi:MAG: energy transducer TonB [Acidobacteriia bacterium]|nr:energy transducer TonB [Terriglobia bacterium]